MPDRDLPPRPDTSGRRARHESRLPAPIRATGPTAEELGLPATVTCPFCGGADTELHSAFGARLSFASYWCHACHTAFDWLRAAPPGAH